MLTLDINPFPDSLDRISRCKNLLKNLRPGICMKMSGSSAISIVVCSFCCLENFCLLYLWIAITVLLIILLLLLVLYTHYLFNSIPSFLISGKPKRHLLTTGWSLFVSGKRLFAGDSVLFIR